MNFFSLVFFLTVVCIVQFAAAQDDLTQSIGRFSVNLFEVCVPLFDYDLKCICYFNR